MGDLIEIKVLVRWSVVNQLRECCRDRVWENIACNTTSDARDPVWTKLEIPVANSIFMQSDLMTEIIWEMIRSIN